MELDQVLIDVAIELLEKRFPAQEGIAEAMYLEDKKILTSVLFEPKWGGGMLCAETGAICEAEKQGKRVIASACVSRQAGDAPIVILTPCGICQERLFHWGQNVEVAVPSIDDATIWDVKTLKEVQPYYWVNAFKEKDPDDEANKNT